MPFRLLARATPFLLGAVAGAIWLRRRQPERPALPMRTGPAAPQLLEAAAEPSEPAPARSEPAPARRFERTRVDIVTVVDDLLGPAR
jgi:uncharacterized membrane protein